MITLGLVGTALGWFKNEFVSFVEAIPSLWSWISNRCMICNCKLTYCCNKQVADLCPGLVGLSRAQSWRLDLDRLEKEMKSASKERAEAASNMSLLLGTIRKQKMDTENLAGLLEMKKDEVDHLKTQMEVLINSSQSVASSDHFRLDVVEKSGQDLRIRQSDPEKNMF